MSSSAAPAAAPAAGPGRAAPVLTDGVVTLRAHREDDADAVVEQCQDPSMARWTTVPQPYLREHAVGFLASRATAWEQGQAWSFAIEAGGRFAGSVDLRPEVPGAAEIGYGLHPAARGKGVMSRAVRLAVTWGFETAGLDAVHWRALIGNWTSRRVAWATGFRVEGTVRGMLAPSSQSGPGPQDGWIGSVRRGDALRPAHPWFVPAQLRAAPLALPDGRTRAGVRLREHREGDVPAMTQAGQDPVSQAWLPDMPVPYTQEDARIHLEHIRAQHASGGAYYWAVADPGDDRLVGEIALFGMAGGTSDSGEVGYWTHPQARGRGVMSAAVDQVRRHALAPAAAGGLGLHRVVLRAADGNEASMRVALNAGFRPAGRDRTAELLRDGRRVDLLRFDAVAGDRT